jgi:hypothetical protein
VDVFLKELPGFPSEKELELTIEQKPGTALIARTPYCVDTERGVNQYQVQFKNLFQLILKPFNYIQ